MKRMIVDTMIGRAAVSLRERAGLLRSSCLDPGGCGMAASDLLAGVLVGGLCRENGTFLDVGSHIGSVVARVSRCRPTARVVAIEAVPEKAEHLRRTFPRAEVHACAVGESDGEATFFVDTRRSGYSSLLRPAGAGGSGSGSVEIRVPLRRLDGIVSGGAGDVDLIKIDVEGAELGVLRGGERLVAESRPTIMFESGPPPRDGAGYTKEALWDWFDGRGYAVLVPNRVAHDDPGLGRDGFLESHLYPRRTSNYFAVPRERRTEIRDRARAVLKVRSA